MKRFTLVFGLLMPVAVANADILYSATTQTGSRFNPGLGGDPAGSGVQFDVTYDDVPIPAARLGGFTSVDVTRVTVGVRRAGTDFNGGAPETTVNLFWATATTTTTPPDTQLDSPGNMFGTAVMAARTTTGFTTELVTIGDGSTTLFTAPLNTTLIGAPGDFGSLMIGLQIMQFDASSLNGWRITSGPDGNADAFWLFDSDLADPERGPVSFGGAPVAQFYIEVEGVAVPEPAGLMLLSLAGLGLLRRRR